MTAPTVAGGGYAWWVSSTIPFTWTADAAVALGFALMAVPAAASFLHVSGRRSARRLGSGPLHSLETNSDRPFQLRTWLAAITVVLAYELFTYIAGSVGSRHSFPTLSSLYDDAASSQAAKAIFVFAWLVLGWGLFHRRRNDHQSEDGRR